jgi:hypothetical protein
MHREVPDAMQSVAGGDREPGSDSPYAKAEQIGALLTGYEESPSVSTTGSGEFTATVDGDVIS